RPEDPGASCGVPGYGLALDPEEELRSELTGKLALRTEPGLLERPDRSRVAHIRAGHAGGRARLGEHDGAQERRQDPRAEAAPGLLLVRDEQVDAGDPRLVADPLGIVRDEVGLDRAGRPAVELDHEHLRRL